MSAYRIKYSNGVILAEMKSSDTSPVNYPSFWEEVKDSEIETIIIDALKNNKTVRGSRRAGFFKSFSITKKIRKLKTQKLDQLIKERYKND